MKQGILIGFASSGRKKLITSCSTEKLQEYLELVRNKGFIETSKNVQQGLFEFYKQVQQCHFIFLVIAYGRLDIMKRQLNLLMSHFKPYSDQVYLIITNFERSQNLEDILEIKNKLATPWNIQNCFAHQCLTKVGIIIDCDKNQTDGYQFFKQLSQIHQQKQIIFDPILMNLEIQYDTRILEMLQLLVEKHRQNDSQIQNKFSSLSQISDKHNYQQEHSNESSNIEINKEILNQKTNNKLHQIDFLDHQKFKGFINNKHSNKSHKKNKNQTNFIKKNKEEVTKMSQSNKLKRQLTQEKK